MQTQIIFQSKQIESLQHQLQVFKAKNASLQKDLTKYKEINIFKDEYATKLKQELKCLKDQLKTKHSQRETMTTFFFDSNCPTVKPQPLMKPTASQTNIEQNVSRFTNNTYTYSEDMSTKSALVLGTTTPAVTLDALNLNNQHANMNYVNLMGTIESTQHGDLPLGNAFNSPLINIGNKPSPYFSKCEKEQNYIYARKLTFSKEQIYNQLKNRNSENFDTTNQQFIFNQMNHEQNVFFLANETFRKSPKNTDPSTTNQFEICNDAPLIQTISDHKKPKLISFDTPHEGNLNNNILKIILNVYIL